MLLKLKVSNILFLNDIYKLLLFNKKNIICCFFTKKIKIILSLCEIISNLSYFNINKLLRL